VTVLRFVKTTRIKKLHQDNDDASTRMVSNKRSRSAFIQYNHTVRRTIMGT
jgi:hypothetical protein